MKITITREDSEIFTATAPAFWSDGSALAARVAIKAETLSANRAQTIDAGRGFRYLLVSPFSIRNAAIVATARGLGIGESLTVAI